MSVAFLVTTVVTILLALVGYIVTYRNNLRLSQRQERLARLGRQLSEFYGPLLAISNANEMAWRRFRAEYRSDTPYFFASHDPPTEAELEAWRLWMSKVFVPKQ
jgi:hypothetical protein